MKRLLFIVNTHTGKADAKSRYIDVIDIFIRNGYEVTVHIPQHPTEMTHIVHQRASAYDILVVCGGDGSLNEAINGLMLLERKPLLGFIPGGTTNDFAATLNLPSNPLEAAYAIMAGEPRYLDIGSFNGKYFTYVAAFGAFTQVPYQTSQSSKNIFGKAAYWMEGMKALTRIKPIKTRFMYDGEMLSIDTAIGVISNSSSVAGFRFRNLSEASLSDGLLEATLVKMPSTFKENQQIAASMLRMDFEDNANSIFFYKTPSLDIDFDEPVAWTVDGEYAGKVDHAHIGLINDALQIIMPPSRVASESMIV